MATGSSSANDGRYMLKYHANQGTWLAAYFAASTGPIFVHTATINSSLAVSNGSITSISGLGGGTNGYSIDVTNENRIVITWQRNDVARAKQLTLSGTTATALSGEREILVDGGNTKDRFVSRYMGHNNLIAAFASRQGNGFYFGTADTTVSGSNMTTENYIGIANSTVSDGATATIDVSGATNSSQSSLTPGQKYYVQADGTLGLTAATPEVFAGTAVAATKIIVNDQQPAYAAPTDGWKFLNSFDGTLNYTSGSVQYSTIIEDLDSTYSDYDFIKVVFFCRSTSGSEPDNIALQVKTGSTWQTGNTYANSMMSLNSGSVQTYNGTSDNRIRLDRYGAETNFQGTATLFDIQSTTHPKVCEINSSQFNNDLSDFFPARSSGGYKGSNDAITGLRFYTYASYGTLDLKWTVYGQKC